MYVSVCVCLCVCLCLRACLEAVLWKCSPRKVLYKHEANSQENNHAEVSSQQSRFETRNHNHVQMHP